MPINTPTNDANPWALIASVPPELRSQPVLNGYTMGGPLILKGIRPYIDGRADMYGDELVVDYANIVHGDAKAFDAAVQRWNIRWAIISKKNGQLEKILSTSPGWQLLRKDGVGTIYVRR